MEVIIKLSLWKTKVFV